MKKLLQLLTGLAIYIIAIGPVRAAGDGVEPIIPDTTDIKFTPWPAQPQTLAKGGVESYWLRPKHKGDTVYYRILSVTGADQTAPIGKEDTKVEMGAYKDWLAIHVTEDMLDENSQFIVKAATWRETTQDWSENTIAAYNVVVGEHTSASVLKFVSGEPTQFMVGESYEMQLKVDAHGDSINLYRNAQPVQLVINSPANAGIDIAEVAYKSAESDPWTVLPADEWEDLIRIPGSFPQFAETGVWVKLTMSRKKRTDEIELALSITLGYSYLDSRVISSIIYKTVPCVDRPVADPAFSPAPGYIAKGSTVTLSSTEGATIYYTTDGTEPTPASTEYTAPITINALTTIKARAYKDDGSSFVSEAAYSVVGIPQVTPEANTGWILYDSLVTITLEPATEGAKIYYTTDSTEPTSASTEYTAPFKLRTKNLRVIAIKDADQSPIVTQNYKLRPAPPTATPSDPGKNCKVPYGTKVKLECTMDGAEIHWRIGGNNPLTEADALYTEEIEIKETCLLKAVAYYNGVASQQVTFSYTVTLAAPEFSIPDGEVPEGAQVKITSKSVEANTTPNKKIYIAYTLDGSDPDKNSTKYTAPIEITKNVTIKAITWTVWTQGYEQSEISTAIYTVEGSEPDDPETPALPETVEAPVFEPVAGEVEKGTAVNWTWNEAYNAYDVVGVVYVANGKAEDLNIDGEKYYELLAAFEAEDETTVREDGVVYLYLGEEAGDVYPYVIEKDVTVKACLAVGVMKDGEEGEEPEIELVLSPVATAAYTVKGDEPIVVEVAKPTFNPAAGEVEKGTKVSIACATEGAVIYYTVDGSEPTAESTEYKEAIAIDKAMTVKAIAIKGEAKSEVATAAYTVKTANEGLELAGVNVYPNPSDGVFNLELPVAATIEVFMSNGMLYRRVNAAAGETTLNIDRSGIYFLRITGEGRTVIKRVIVR